MQEHDFVYPAGHESEGWPDVATNPHPPPTPAAKVVHTVVRECSLRGDGVAGGERTRSFVAVCTRMLCKSTNLVLDK